MEQLRLPSFEQILISTHEGILPYKESLMDLAEELNGKRVSVTHESSGEAPKVEKMIFGYFEGAYKAVVFRPKALIGTMSTSHYTLIGNRNGISKISLGWRADGQVIYTNPTVGEYLRTKTTRGLTEEERAIEKDKYEKIWLKGRWLTETPVFNQQEDDNYDI